MSLSRLLKLHDTVTRAGFFVAVLIVLVIAACYCYEVAARYFFSAPTAWSGAVVSYLMCALIFLAAPEQARVNAHISITALIDLASPARREVWIRVIAACGAITCFIIAWICGAETWSQFQDRVLTVGVFEVPKWWISIFISYGLGNCGLYFFRETFSRANASQSPGVLPQ